MITPAQIASWDQQDELKKYRAAFLHPEPDLIYLDGNSLGRIALKSREALMSAIDHQWSQRLIRSWNEGWYDMTENLAAKLAPIIGAKSNEVMIADNTSTNLFKLVVAALRLQENRKQIISDELNFPTDIYILQGVIDLLNKGHQLDLVPSRDGMTIAAEAVKEFISEQTALLTLSQVVFKSAWLYPMQELNSIAHQQGALVLWDLSHSVGAVPIHLNETETDLAIGCTYKYLNGGPGAPAFLYVSERLQEKLESPIWGWFGADNPFNFTLNYQPASGIRNYATGTPPILSLTALAPALDLIEEAGMKRIRQKSMKLTELIKDMSREHLLPLDFSFGSPLEAIKRGSHFSLRHPEAYRICQALISDKIGKQVIIPDFRAPDNIRLGVNPLYNSYADVFQAIGQIKEIVENKWYQKFNQEAKGVT